MFKHRKPLPRGEMRLSKIREVFSQSMDERRSMETAFDIGGTEFRIFGLGKGEQQDPGNSSYACLFGYGACILKIFIEGSADS